jgi:uncharacterized GH25 family protein
MLSLFLFCLPAGAHMLWLNPANYHPAVGSTVEIGIGWGHRYPADRIDEPIKKDRVEAIQAVDPDGRTVQLEAVAIDRYQLKIEKAGAYIVTARIKPGFFTMTPEGRKWGDKKSIANAVKCTNFHIEAKAVLIAGGDAKNFDAAAGQALELVPVTDPQSLTSGGTFIVNALYKEKPIEDVKVKAVYAGYEAKKTDEPAASGKDKHASGGHYPVETVTDAAGRAQIPVDRAGYWLVVLSYKPAYPDPAVCDEYMHNVTYALEVK